MVVKMMMLTLMMAGGFLLHPPDCTVESKGQQDKAFICENGKIKIKSTAPLESIEAQSSRLHGALDPVTQAFTWYVEVKTFQGFNSPLQKEHFNENYLESEQFPRASFSGKIIEKTDFTKDGVYFVRAKGQFVVHGVDQERIIKSKIEVKNGKVSVHANFKMLLADHDISIPRIVYQKIAEEVDIIVDADLK
jgi:hypothetical protein